MSGSVSTGLFLRQYAYCRKNSPLDTDPNDPPHSSQLAFAPVSPAGRGIPRQVHCHRSPSPQFPRQVTDRLRPSSPVRSTAALSTAGKQLKALDVFNNSLVHEDNQNHLLPSWKTSSPTTPDILFHDTRHQMSSPPSQLPRRTNSVPGTPRIPTFLTARLRPSPGS